MCVGRVNLIRTGYVWEMLLIKYKNASSVCTASVMCKIKNDIDCKSRQCFFLKCKSILKGLSSKWVSYGDFNRHHDDNGKLGLL